MKVTAVNRKFGKHKPGEVFDFPDKAARLFIKVGKLAEAPASQAYITRDMRPAPTPVAVIEAVEPKTVEDSAEETEESAEEAPYGYKADGTPRKRPGRPAASE